MSRIRVEELEDYGTGEVFRVSGLARKEGTLEVVEYGEGVLIESRNTLIRDADNKFWVVSSNTTLPYVMTGAGIPEDGALVPVGGVEDAVLRQELADPDKGAAMVAYRGGSVADKLDEIVSGGGGGDLPGKVSALEQFNADLADSNKGTAMVARSAQYVDSISELRNLKRSSQSKHAVVTGYYQPNDGGGGVYVLDDMDSVSPDNGGSIIVAADGGRWKLTHDGVMSVRQFGAKGDGVTIDDDAINSALSAIETEGGGELYFPRGIYQVTHITWDIETLNKYGRRVSLVGDGPSLSVVRSNSLLNIDQGAMSVIARYQTAMNSLIAGVQFSNMGFESSNGQGVSFRAEALAFCYFENCLFTGGDFAFFGVGMLSSSFTNCRFIEATETGLRLQKGAGFSFPNAITLNQCVISDNQRYGIYADNSGGIRMFGGSVEGNGAGVSSGTGGGVVLDHAAPSAGTAIAAAFYGVYFEFNNGNADIRLVHNNPTENVSLSVADSSFACGGAGTTVTDRIVVEHLSATALTVSVHGCNFQELSGFVPTVNNKYIRIYGTGTGQRKCTGFGNYFNHPNSFPIPGQFTEILSPSSSKRVESQTQVANASGEVTFTYPAFSSNPDLSVAVIDSGARVTSVKCTNRTPTSATFRVVWYIEGSWVPGEGMRVSLVAVGS